MSFLSSFATPNWNPPITWSDAALKFGNPGQRRQAEMQRQRAAQRLIQLEQEESQREANKTGPFSSGINNSAGEYTAMLNRQGEIADIRSRLSGRGPANVQHSYKGTSFAERDNMLPGLRQTRPGAGSLSLGLDPEDPQVRAMLMERFASENDILDTQRRAGRLQLDAGIGAHIDNLRRPAPVSQDHELFSGMAAARGQRMGELENQAGLMKARGAAEAFMDPTVSRARGQQVDEQERLLTARYGREADALARVEAARIAAEGRVGAANATAQGALTREAIRGLLKSRELQQLLGGQEISPEQAAGLESLLNRYAGGGAEEPQGIDDASFEALLAGARVNPQGADQLAQYWAQLSPQQQARVRQVMGGR